MQLPFLKHSEKPPSNQKRQYFFALQIAHNLIKSAVWSIINDRPQVLSVGTAVSWDDQSDSSLITASDESLSDAVTHLDPAGHIQPSQVILGLPPDWSTGDKISPSRLPLLKSLSSKLSLEPIGFVITHEAIIRFIHQSEGLPPTAILLGFWPQYLELVLVRLGKSDVAHLIKRSSQIESDVLEGLGRYPHIDMLPSRMLLYDSGLDLEQIKQTLLAQPWLSSQKKLPFLHFPKIEILPSDYAIRAIALSGGSEVAHALGLLPDPVVAPTPPTDLGFVEQDSLPVPAEEPTEVYIPLPSSTSRPVHQFNFPRPSFTRLPSLGLLTFVGLLLGVCGLFAAYWFLPTAQVTIFVTPRPLEHEFDFTSSSRQTTPDPANLILPSQIQSTEVSGQKSTSTTGTKTIGDKSTGTVTIYNGTDVQRKFVSGSTLTSPSGLKFVLDTNITVASASGAVPNIQYGKSQAQATAAQIGSQYNLTAGTVFKIGTFSEKDISAQNDTAFSGGSTQQVRAVSKSDIASLRLALSDQLKSESLKKLQQNTPPDHILIDQSQTFSTLSESFDHKLDEVADSLQLSLKIQSLAMTVSKSQLDDLVHSQISPKIPDGFVLSDKISPSFTLKKASSDSAVLTTSVKVSLLPALNQSEIIKNIAGKYPTTASTYLKSLTGIARVDFLISPPLPVQISTLPHVPSRVHLSIQPQP